MSAAQDNLPTLADLAFNENLHQYSVHDIVLPNVTGICDPLTDFSKVPHETMVNAQRFGTYVHLAAELFLQQNLDRGKLPDNVAGCIDALENMLAERMVEPVHTEMRVWSPRHRFAGTLDMIGMYQGEMCLFDWKTGSAFPRAVGPQLAAYKQCLEEWKLYKGLRRVCVRLHSNGTYHLDPCDSPADWGVFQSCLNIHNWLRKNVAG